jgi:KipI family sensor histidine kinase inhibitor
VIDAADARVRIPIEVEEQGDGAVMVTVASPDPAVRRREIPRFRHRVLAHRPHAVVDVVSGLESLLVEYDPLETSAENVAYGLRLLARLAVPADAGAPPVVLDVPFVADAQTAPDLEEVAAELSITPEELLARIQRSTLTVALLAAAMAPMTEGLDVPAPVRRRAEPRTDVAAGAIMIAGRNLIIQPFPGPSGWRVVGRTPLRIVDIRRAAPVSFAPGDSLRLLRIDRAEAAGLDGRFLRARTGAGR